MKIIFDGKEVTGNENATNLVEFLDEQGIEIVAPCFRSKRAGGCCSACGLEVDGKKEFACTLKPKNGMKIVYNRQDLINDRKEKFLEFQKVLKEGKENSCCKCSCKNC